MEELRSSFCCMEMWKNEPQLLKKKLEFLRILPNFKKCHVFSWYHYLLLRKKGQDIRVILREAFCAEAQFTCTWWRMVGF